ncbi:hypothetical protein Kpho02_66030 [Kitasatospora phosalacinea]|uniref:PknH-like extracellular domain-containing protein n=1 Tax=Kitasatospora phosalacinea TaxID=2065 RepID=A0A9W6QD86_9ACTN|nr:hypothetical protein [Kitasatospora phosalacinea]GLW74305.1 hypothetical protein Kpho02_66030 [Kitasatospora phosalacinea]
MRSLRLAAATVACLSAVALLSACDPDGTDNGDSAAPAASSPAAPTSGGAKSPAPAKSSAAAAGAADRLPAGVWIDPKAVPMNSALHWKAPASAAKPLGSKGQLRIEALCKIPRDASFAEVPMVETASLGAPSGDWAADETIASFGSAAKSSGRAQSAFGLLGAVADGLKSCDTTAPGATVAVSTDDSTFLAATLTVPTADGGSTEVHEYLSVQGGSVAELTLRAQLTKGSHPKTAWSAPADAGLLDTLGKTVCTALGDC